MDDKNSRLHGAPVRIGKVEIVEIEDDDAA